MDSEKIKEIWKANAVKQIDNYTDSEITSIILKSARQAIDRSFYGLVFWGVLILFLLACLWIMVEYSVTPMQRMYGYIVTSISLIVLFVAFFLSEWGRREAKRYSFDVPLKEWIEHNIRDFDKGIERLKRSWLLKYGFGVLALLIFIAIRIFIVGFDTTVVFVALAAGLISLIIASTIGTKKTLKRMTETRDGLQDLYDQLDDTQRNE